MQLHVLFSIQGFYAIMYSVYVTNKSRNNVFIRLQHEKLSAVNPSLTQELRKLQRADKESYLVRWGFCLILPEQTKPFAVDVANDGTRKYASLYEDGARKLWNMDYEMNCMRYGCLFVDSTLQFNTQMFHLTQANPEPVWISAKQGDALSSNIVKVGLQGGLSVYLGRSSYGSIPCSVTVTSGIQFENWVPLHNVSRPEQSGDILFDDGHEFVRAKTGDPVPPHAVVAGVSQPEGSLYLGRVGGNMVCSISTEGGKIKSFCYKSQKVQSGEILVLTK